MQVSNCNVFDSQYNVCLLCGREFMLLVNGYRNMCVKRNLQNFHCIKAENGRCIECALGSFMDAKFKCHSIENHNYATTVVISVIIVLLVCVVYGFYIYKCKRKMNEKKKRREQIGRAEALL